MNFSEIEPVGASLLTRLSDSNAVANEVEKIPKSDTNFPVWLENEIAAVDNQIRASETMVQNLAIGDMDNLHQVMMSLEKAKLQFELVVQVRNRLLEGYQEIMRMQV